jgi:hypothetical protein
MDTVKLIADFFLVSLSLSYTLFSPIASSELTGNGFIKLISNVSIGAIVVSLIVAVMGGGVFIQTTNLLKIVALVGLICTTVFHQDKKSVLMWIIYFIICSSLAINVYIFTGTNLSKTIFLFGSTFLLGIITYAMTLGHWYLVVPKLSERPLVIAAKITWFILILKIILSGFSLFKNWEFFEENTLLGSGYAFNWVLLLMRVLFGYIVIAGMSYFNFRLVKMRSIQSSTGILYAMTFFVFIGELISSYMFFNYGLLI